MIKFNNIEIEGFCSIAGPLTINLGNPNNGVTIIRGANGNGKSSILSSISWVCYGKTPKGVNNVNTWDEIKPSGYKGTKVQLFFTKKDVTYSIIRCQSYKGEVFGAKGSDRLILLEDGIEVKEKSKVAIQQKIIKILGMSYELFNNSLMFGQGVKRLIQESGSDKKKLFEEIFELDYLNVAKQLASNEMSEVKESISVFESELSNLKSNIEESKDTYRKLRNQERNFKLEISRQRNAIKEKISNLKSDLKSINFNEKLLTKSEKELVDLRESLHKLNEEYNKNKDKLSYSNLISSIEEILRLMNHGKNRIAYKELKNTLSTLNQVTKYSSTKESILERMSDLKDVISEESDKYDDISDISHRILEYKSELNNLGKSNNKILSKEYKEKFRNYRSQLRKVTEEYQLKLKEYENYNWLIKDPLGNKGIKSYIMNSSLDFLNKVLDTYTEVLGFRIEFGIDLDSTKKDFYTLIEIDGHIAMYEELSGGQKQLVNIAMAFAMHESQSMSKGFNVLFLDEVFESLSSNNIELVVELIKKMSQDKNIFIITHHDSLPISNCKVITVSRKDGITQIN